MNAMQASLDWYREHAAEFAVIAAHVIIIARLIVRWTPSTVDDGFVAKIIELAKLLGIVIPPEKVDPKAPPLAAMQVQEAFGSFRNRNIDRPLVRRAVRRQARLNGIALTEEMLSEAIGELEVRHEAQTGGPFRDFLTFLMENKETILAVLQIVIQLFADERKDGVA